MILVDGLEGRCHSVIFGLGGEDHDLFEFFEGGLLFILDDLEALDQLLLKLFELLRLFFKFVDEALLFIGLLLQFLPC